MKFGKRIYIVAALIALGNSAWIAEGANNNCAAFEQMVFRETAAKDNGKTPQLGMGLATLFFAASNGSNAARMAAEKFPGIPTALSCNMAYWLHWPSRPTATSASDPSYPGHKPTGSAAEAMILNLPSNKAPGTRSSP